jgi:hypothetical protein
MELYRRNASYDGLIDEEEAIRFTVSRYFREHGWEVMAADDRYETETSDVPDARA